MWDGAWARSWPSINTDARFRVGDNKINLFIYYEVDGDTSKHHLDVSNYSRPGERVSAPRACSVTVQCTGLYYCIDCFLGRRFNL